MSSPQRAASGAKLRRAARSLEHLPAAGAAAVPVNAVSARRAVCAGQVLIEGAHTIQQQADLSRRVISECVAALWRQPALSLEALLLKPQMAIPGCDAAVPLPPPADVAAHTLSVMRWYPPHLLFSSPPACMPFTHSSLSHKCCTESWRSAQGTTCSRGCDKSSTTKIGRLHCYDARAVRCPVGLCHQCLAAAAGMRGDVHPPRVPSQSLQHAFSCEDLACLTILPRLAGLGASVDVRQQCACRFTSAVTGCNIFPLALILPSTSPAPLLGAGMRMPALKASGGMVRGGG